MVYKLICLFKNMSESSLINKLVRGDSLVPFEPGAIPLIEVSPLDLSDVRGRTMMITENGE